MRRPIAVAVFALAALAAAQSPDAAVAVAPPDDAGAATAHAAPLPVDPALRAALDAAEAAQEERDEPAAPVTAHVIKQAPAAVLASGTGDVDTAGERGGRRGRVRPRDWKLKMNDTLLLTRPPTPSPPPSSLTSSGDCAGDIDAFCADVDAGEGRLAACLSERLRQEGLGNVAGEKRERGEE